MTDLDKEFPGGGAEDPRPEVRSMPFFPGPPAPGPSSGPSSTGGVPLPAPAPVPPSTPPAAPPAAPAPEERQAPAIPTATSAAVVKGRITIEDQVIEKIARLAALEVEGVAASSVRPSSPGGPAGGAPPEGTGRPGGRGPAHDNEISLDLTLTVEYGRVVMDVAKEVKTNVARVVSQMLGMRVVAVNISVDDVVLPAAAGRDGRAPA
ncbi:Asp23/Gls24 family envelope stress response protein [Actinomadura rugatobispora]|uniref:Asp23/Gls24 family envelope stress response protein n=1 Tax=Actinomadura rugatobispora TaxID=1994 RepID=A0ABW0ZTX1_9ACTN|nr:hypothetical protein GCM10010200_086400 [Actinomadura rugatobispora]